MIPIGVTAQFDIEGEIFPISFTLKGVQYSIDAVGRKWQDKKGNHYLVMVPSERVFELLFVPERHPKKNYPSLARSSCATIGSSLRNKGAGFSIDCPARRLPGSHLPLASAEL